MRENKFIISVLLLSLISITSCMRDNFRIASGTVLDADTEKPIDSARVESFLVSNKGCDFIEQTYGDSIGYFETGTGPLPRLSDDVDFIILISKTGYKNLVLKNPRETKIFLKKKDVISKQTERNIDKIKSQLKNQN